MTSGVEAAIEGPTVREVFLADGDDLCPVFLGYFQRAIGGTGIHHDPLVGCTTIQFRQHRTKGFGGIQGANDDTDGGARHANWR